MEGEDSLGGAGEDKHDQNILYKIFEIKIAQWLFYSIEHE